jgi:uncharacterized NAD(P)/FAD-binding protein YdhS
MGRRLHDVTIVGGGFSGVATAIHMMETAAASGARLDQVTIVDPDLRRLGGGIAFSPVHASPFHETNIPADRLSVFPDRPLDFVSWWVDRTIHDAIAPSLRYAVPNPYTVAPRQLVQFYMADTLNDVAADAAKATGTRLRTVQDEIIGIEDTPDHVLLQGRKGKLYATGKAVLTTGHLPTRIPGFIDKALAAHPQYINDQWSANGRSGIEAIGRYDAVAILGTGLSAYDAARSLTRQGHLGDISMVSRHGYEHFAYPRVVKAADKLLDLAPRFLDVSGDGYDMAEAASREFYNHTGKRICPFDGDILRPHFWQKGLLGRLFGHNAGQVSTEAVLAVWEKQLPALAEKIGAEQIGALLRDHSSLINTLRVGAGHDIAREIAALKADGQLEVIAGDIDLTYREDGKTIVDCETDHGERELNVDFVIASLGPNTNYAKSGSPLWQDVLDMGYTAPHATGIGVSVDADGRLPGAQHIYAAGTPTAGHRMTTEGIMGPPAYSIPGMRQSIANTANAALRALNI